MEKNKKFFYGFSLCIPDETIIEFIELNNDHGWEWNDICEKLGDYKREGKNDLEYPECFPLCEFGEEDTEKMEYWFEQFLETYKDEIAGRCVYLIKTPN